MRYRQIEPGIMLNENIVHRVLDLGQEGMGRVLQVQAGCVSGPDLGEGDCSAFCRLNARTARSDFGDL